MTISNFVCCDLCGIRLNTTPWERDFVDGYGLTWNDAGRIVIHQGHLEACKRHVCVTCLANLHALIEHDIIDPEALTLERRKLAETPECKGGVFDAEGYTGDV